MEMHYATILEAISDALASAPEVRLNDALIEITNWVRTKTRGRQIPYIEGSLSKFTAKVSVRVTPRAVSEPDTVPVVGEVKFIERPTKRIVG